MIINTELERRKPIWTAFSEFWLDTELDDKDLSRIASIAAASGYSIVELRDIYLYEVAPVVCLNCWSVAGVWTAFDDEWLHATVRRNAEHRSPWLRFCLFTCIGHWFMTDATEHYWHRIVSHLSTPNQSIPIK